MSSIKDRVEKRARPKSSYGTMGKKRSIQDMLDADDDEDEIAAAGKANPYVEESPVGRPIYPTPDTKPLEEVIVSEPKDPLAYEGIKKNIENSGNPVKTSGWAISNIDREYKDAADQIKADFNRDSAKLDAAGKARMRKIMISEMLQNSLNAAALFAGASAGIESKIPLSHPDMSVQLQAHKDKMDRSRKMLSQEVAALRKIAGDRFRAKAAHAKSNAELRDRDENRASADADKDATREGRRDIQRLKVRQKYGAQLDKIYNNKKNSSEDMYKQFTALGIDPKTAADMSGEGKSWFYDTVPGGGEFFKGKDSALDSLTSAAGFGTDSAPSNTKNSSENVFRKDGIVYDRRTGKPIGRVK